MSKNTHIIATAIPSVKPGVKGKFCVSVALSPQLYKRGASVHLGKDYYEIANWPQYAAFFKNAIRFRIISFDSNWKRKNEIIINQQDYNQQFDTDKGMDIWKSMFPVDTPVSHWEESRVPFKIIPLLQEDEMQIKIVHAIDDCIDNLNTNIAFNNTEHIDGNMLSSVIWQLEGLKSLRVAELLEHPFVQDIHNPVMASLKSALENIYIKYHNIS